MRQRLAYISFVGHGPRVGRRPRLGDHFGPAPTNAPGNRIRSLSSIIQPDGPEVQVTAQDSTTTEGVRFTPDGKPRFAGVQLTSSAAAKVKELIEADGGEMNALRLGVKRAGCSGYAYDMFFDSQVDDTDIVNTTDGVSVVVDAESVMMVEGATIDFKDNGLDGAGFAIENPNVTGTCGCGKSFS
ncbi:MAG: iron-sulfur cluster assembly accessory protein [Acidimicrobiia bacterium]|nr:iron-sulfur cluster assembly accessory protein [Acidimicrobiia bacterium]